MIVYVPLITNTKQMFTGCFYIEPAKRQGGGESMGRAYTHIHFNYGWLHGYSLPAVLVKYSQWVVSRLLQELGWI